MKILQNCTTSSPHKFPQIPNFMGGGGGGGDCPLIMGSRWDLAGGLMRGPNLCVRYKGLWNWWQFGRRWTLWRRQTFSGGFGNFTVNWGSSPDPSTRGNHVRSNFWRKEGTVLSIDMVCWKPCNLWETLYLCAIKIDLFSFFCR